MGKNILFLTWKDIKHPNAGGAEKVIREYAKNLVKFGHNVTWFASGFDGGENEEIIDGVKIIRRYNINTIYFKAWKWYKGFIKNNEVDIVIDEAGGIPLFSPFYVKNKKLFFMIHHIGDKEWDYAFPFPINKIAKFVFNQIIKLYKNIPTITVSNSTKQELENDFGFKKVFVVENTLDLKPLKQIEFEKKEKFILFLGRLMPIKRVEDSIKVFYEFNKFDNSYILNIVGNQQDKKYFQKLKKLVKHLNLKDKVNFISYSKENALDYLLKSKLMLVTSYKEGFGLIVLEGNAYGLPVIAYNVAGLRDSVKNGINGVLVEDGNYKLMAEKMLEILKDERKYKKLAESSLKYVKNLDGWEEKVRELEKIILV